MSDAVKNLDITCSRKISLTWTERPFKVMYIPLHDTLPLKSSSNLRKINRENLTTTAELILWLAGRGMSTSNPPPEPGHFSLLYFATASSFTKKDGENLKAPLPLSRLFDTLEERYPGIRQAVLGSCAVTVNLEYVDVDGDEHNNQDQDGITGGNGHESGGKGLVIQEGDEVAIIPPVSSG